MNKRAFLASALLFSAFLPVRGQQPQPQSSPSPRQQSTPTAQQRSAPQVDNEDVVRITSNLVQVDAVVTDKSGKPVTDLKPEEFEILEDGRAQRITNFSHVVNEPTVPIAVGATGSASTPGDENLPPVHPTLLSPEHVRRTIAIVVDDLGLSFESMAQMKRLLRKYVDEQMQPGDLVSILRTGNDVGALQQFTNDKRLLYSAIERVRWNICSRSGNSVVPAVRQGAIQENVFVCGVSSSPQATLRALRFIVQGMRELPGRKSLVILSDGIPTEQQESVPRPFDSKAQPRRDQLVSANELTEAGNTVSYLEPLRMVAELAIRASVVIYGLDTRGVQFVYGPTAADDFSGISWERRDAIISQRIESFQRNSEGPESLARQTGGFMIQGTNDLAGGLRRIVEDQKAYYLLGYRPVDETFDRRFHHLKVRVKRNGLTVRTRTGFYGISEDDAHKALTPRDQTLAALISPFGVSEINLRLTALYANVPPTGQVVRSFLHIDCSRLTFTDEPDGWHQTTFDLTGVLFGDNGRVAGEYSQTETLRLRGEAYETLLHDGFVDAFSVPAKKSGVYQLRVAVRDLASMRLGGAGQVVEVPDLSNDSLALSGVILSSGDYLDAALAQFNGQGKHEKRDEAKAAIPAVRQVRPDMMLGYAFYVYNARIGESGRPRLKLQVHLLRDGKQVYTSTEKVIDFDQIGDPKRLLVTSRLMPDERLPPGEYGLQVVVTDMLANNRQHAVTQSIDFEIVQAADGRP